MAGNESFNDSRNGSDEQWPSRSEIMSSPYWYMSMLVEIFVILANAWVAIAFVTYIIKKKVFAKKRSRKDVNGGMVMVFAIAAIVLPFIRYTGTVFLLVVGLFPEKKWGCEVAYDVGVFGFAFSLCPTYAYLWARQRAFYGHPSLGNMFGRFVNVFSKISMLLILLSAAVSVGLGIHPKEYEPGPGGCFLIGSQEQDDYRTYVYTVLMISSQISLLGLFLHPLVVHTRHQRSFEKSIEDKAEVTRALSSTDGFTSFADGEESVGYSEQQLSPNGVEIKKPSYNRSASVPEKSRSRSYSESDRKRYISEPPLGDRKIELTTSFDYLSKAKTVVKKFRKGVRSSSKNRQLFVLIRRVLYLAIISIFSDLTVMALNQFAVPDDIPQTYSFVMYDVSILINIFTVVLSFVKWRKMLVSPCVNPK